MPTNELGLSHACKIESPVSVLGFEVAVKAFYYLIGILSRKQFSFPLAYFCTGFSRREIVNRHSTLARTSICTTSMTGASLKSPG